MFNNIDFSKLDNDKVYVGNIELIVGIDDDLLKEINILGLKDCHIALKTVVAKSDATLIKISDDIYIDFDINNFEYINYCLENNIIHDNNSFLSSNTKNPFIGQLIVSNVKNIEKKLTLK